MGLKQVKLFLLNSKYWFIFEFYFLGNISFQNDVLMGDRSESHVFAHSSYSSVSTGSQSSSESEGRDIFEDEISTQSMLNDEHINQFTLKVSRNSTDKHAFNRQLNFTPLHYYDDSLLASNSNSYSDVNITDDSLCSRTQSSKVCSQQHIYNDQVI